MSNPHHFTSPTANIALQCVCAQGTRSFRASVLIELFLWSPHVCDLSPGRVRARSVVSPLNWSPTSCGQEPLLLGSIRLLWRQTFFFRHIDVAAVISVRGLLKWAQLDSLIQWNACKNGDAVVQGRPPRGNLTVHQNSDTRE